jgi:hypothetical protein
VYAFPARPVRFDGTVAARPTELVMMMFRIFHVLLTFLCILVRPSRCELSEFFADGIQFLPARCRGLGIFHLKLAQRVEHDLRYDQPRIFFVIGGNDMPGRVMGACRAQAFLIRIHVILPVASFVNIGQAEFPVPVRVVEPFEQAFPLFVLRKMKKDFDDLRAVAVEVFFHIHDGTIPVLPNMFFVQQFVGNSLGTEQLRMYASDEHLLVIGTIEDADLPSFRQPAGSAPKKIVLPFFGARLLETEHLASFRIDTGQDVPDRAVLAGGIHALKNEEQRILAGGIEKLLQRAQLNNVFFQQLSIRLTRFA